MIVVEHHPTNGKFDGMPYANVWLWNGKKFSPLKQLNYCPQPCFHLDESGIITISDRHNEAMKFKWHGSHLDTLEEITIHELPSDTVEIYNHHTHKTIEHRGLPPEYNDYIERSYTLFTQHH
ncbi:MAG TPA: hypothetical protein VFH95_08550 [Candidatus Kapabacteria bacterium]|nr:hypothetical protein [Candidatus Kapabacteria bacterium]